MSIFQRYAFQTLKKNKTRTLVTILGIILSVALFTAVTTSVYSLQIFIRNLAIERSGDWNIEVDTVTKEFIEETKGKEDIADISYLKNYGYAMLEESQNEYKPYLFLAGFSENFSKHRNIILTEGRMPENGSEVILPKHLYDNGGVEYHIGEVITLKLGNRYSEDGEYMFTQDNMWQEGEYIGETRECSFTIVGFYQRPDFEPHSAPGYTALTTSEMECQYYDMVINLENPKYSYEYGRTYFVGKKAETSDKFTTESYNIKYNSDLVRSYGVFREDSLASLLYGFAVVLILIIMAGSISLIYNSFQISVSERTKQFGILSSIGATKKQMIHTVLWEGVFLSLAAIPAGLIVGITGIGTTLYLLRDSFTKVMGTKVLFELHISVWSVMIAVCISIITVLVSAWLPARRAMKMPILDAVKMRQDIKITKRQIRVSPVTSKLFGIWGMIAVKNYKRSKKKYRATILSLFFSVVLFISAGSYSQNMMAAIMGTGTQVNDYDIGVTFSSIKYSENWMENYQKVIENTEGVGNFNVGAMYYNATAKLEKEQFSKDYLKYFQQEGPASEDTSEIPLKITFLNHDAFLELLEDNHLSEREYLDTDSPKALYSANGNVYSQGKYRNFKMLDKDTDRLKAYCTVITEDKTTEDGGFENKEMKDIILGDEITKPAKGNIGGRFNVIELVYDESMMQPVFQDMANKVSIVWAYVDADKKSGYSYTKLEENLDKALSESSKIDDYYIFNAAESRDSDYAMIRILQVFAFGFIILISLIATANVFNTISTNLGLRRREFAMLKSYGMTEKGFLKMLNLECLLYGTKSLLFGLPVSIAISYLIYRMVNGSVETPYLLPAGYIAVAVVSVFAVVFVTMIYSRNKIQKENVIDVLKSEVD